MEKCNYYITNIAKYPVSHTLCIQKLLNLETETSLKVMVNLIQ